MAAVELFEYGLGISGPGAGAGQTNLRARDQLRAADASGSVQQHDSAGRTGPAEEEGIEAGDAGGSGERCGVRERSGCGVAGCGDVAGPDDAGEADQVSAARGEAL